MSNERPEECPTCGGMIQTGEGNFIVGLHIYAHKGTCSAVQMANLATAGQLDLQLAEPEPEPKQGSCPYHVAFTYECPYCNPR